MHLPSTSETSGLAGLMDGAPALTCGGWLSCRSEHSSDDEDDDSGPRKPVPAWARGQALAEQLMRQVRMQTKVASTACSMRSQPA